MPCVNIASLRDEFDAAKAPVASLGKEGKSTREADEVIDGLCRLSDILIAIILEKTTKKTSYTSEHMS